MSGDGIYSGVLTSYPSTGRYTFTMRVSATTNTLVPDLSVVAHSVGGSMAHHKQLIPTGEFVRTVRGPVINIQHLPSTLPPGKITDFTVTVADEGRLTTTWTSSGGDYSSGWVAGYRFIYSARISDLVAPNGEPAALLSLDKHQAAGVKTSQEVYFPHYDTDYYMAVVAVDEEGNRGPPSNLVHVYVPGPVADPVVSVAEPGPAFNLLSSEKDWIMVGVICGILLVLIVISVVSISYFCCMSSRRGSKVARKVSTSASISDVHVASSGSSDHTDGTDAGSFDSDMKNLSAGHIAPYDAEYGYNPRHVEVETPTKDNSTRATPVYWSASQLLSKLEEEGSYSPHPDYYYAANASRLEVVPDYMDHRAANIPEEFCVTVSNLTSKYNRENNVHLSDGRSNRVDGHRHSHRGGRAEKMPPPLYPKPKNITQV